MKRVQKQFVCFKLVFEKKFKVFKKKSIHRNMAASEDLWISAKPWRVAMPAGHYFPLRC